MPVVVYKPLLEDPAAPAEGAGVVIAGDGVAGEALHQDLHLAGTGRGVDEVILPRFALAQVDADVVGQVAVAGVGVEAHHVAALEVADRRDLLVPAVVALRVGAVAQLDADVIEAPVSLVPVSL